jgi:hypothetical protein
MHPSLTPFLGMFSHAAVYGGGAGRFPATIVTTADAVNRDLVGLLWFHVGVRSVLPGKRGTVELGVGVSKAEAFGWHRPCGGSVASRCHVSKSGEGRDGKCQPQTHASHCMASVPVAVVIVGVGATNERDF